MPIALIEPFQLSPISFNRFIIKVLCCTEIGRRGHGSGIGVRTC